MRERHSLLDYAMNNQTKNTKDYPLIQDILFTIKRKEQNQDASNRHVNQNKEAGKYR